GVVEYYADPLAMFSRLFGWTRERLLISVSSHAAGPRGAVRHLWLQLHGVHARLYRAAELERLLSRIPGASIRVDAMPQAHCASAVHSRGPREEPLAGDFFSLAGV